jgi:predicted phosphodiesterase
MATPKESSVTKPLRIAVLSDHHIDTKTAPGSWRLAQRAFKTVATAKPDHVVIAGDLFDCSTAMLRDRDRVEKYLRRLGLWHRDRLTIVVGNPDIFHTPHHGSRAHKLGEYARAAGHRAARMYAEFGAWVSDLARADDCLAENDLYPLRKRLGHVTLLAADTTAATTKFSGNGYWRKDDDRVLRGAVADSGERCVLAMHNAPFVSAEQTVTAFLKGELEVGFPRREHRRLGRFTDYTQVDAIVCGHIHDMGEDDDDEDPWYWEIGDKWTCEVHCVGRTGGVHHAILMFGILTVPMDGDDEMDWEEFEV